MTVRVADMATGSAARSTEPVLIIGAGPGGLAAAAELNRLGVPTQIVERNDTIASAWRGRYDRLRLNTCRWQSTLPGERWPKGTPMFPTRDQVVGYFEDYAERLNLAVRFGVDVGRIDPCDGGWSVSTSAGLFQARQVIVAIGRQHTPRFPVWPGADQYPGRILHSAEYRNPKDFQGADVLVVGSGCSGMEIAGDLALGGAARVRLSVRTQPNLVLRAWGPVPDDVLVELLYPLPPRHGDAVARFLRRRFIGDLSPWGLTPPKHGVLSGVRAGNDPSVVDTDVIRSLKDGKIEVVAGVASVDQQGVRLADEDGTMLQPDVIVAATGFTTGLGSLVGHLGVLNANDMPHVHRGRAALPGLRLIGYDTLIKNVGKDARRAAREISQELRLDGKPPAGQPGSMPKRAISARSSSGAGGSGRDQRASSSVK